MCVYDSYSDIIYFVGNASGSWVGILHPDHTFIKKVLIPQFLQVINKQAISYQHCSHLASFRLFQSMLNLKSAERATARVTKLLLVWLQFAALSANFYDWTVKMRGLLLPKYFI